MKLITLSLSALRQKGAWPATALALALFGAGVAHADTTVLVSDTLTSVSSTTLQGRTPDIADSSHATYDEGQYGSFETSATGAANSDQSVSFAALGVGTIQSGAIYTLTVTESGADGGYSELGFVETSVTPGGSGTYQVAGPTVLVGYGNAEGEGASATAYSGSIIDSSTVAYGSLPSTSSADTNTLQLRLDTEGTNWTITAYENGVQLLDGLTPASYSYATNPTLNAIEFGNGGGGSSFTDLTLVETTPSLSVPEPATWAFLGAGLVSLAALARFRRQRI